ncbi:phage baseplate assembly protein V [Ralstonia pseudosolanacearum]|uniref:phage baseplate assembly protein V n=1 Tax=Ralstonia pseudosolanacearum TaxID=1310165 RepID=UPI001FFA13BB|nr:phage baseplate assembly protein V [Ralstonia pseudosolanacearum]
MDTADLARLLENLLRIGTIAEIRHTRPPAVRVRTGGITTTWRPWAERRAGRTRTWNPPTVGEQVLLFCPSGDPANAVILCGIPTDDNDVPSNDPNRTVTLYPDGALTSYDHAAGLLTVQGVKTVFLEAAANVLVKAPNTTFDGDVTVKGRFAYENGIAGHGGENGNKITGSLTHEGGQLSSNGVVLDKHDHWGVQRGGDWTEGTR